MTDEALSLKVVQDMPTLRELTTAKLRQAILELRFRPGQHLIERDLCERTGVSRSCVREALRHLEAESLVERRGARGLFVSSLTASEARQIYEVRAAIEPEMGRLFAERATAENIAALRQVVKRLEKAQESSSVGAYAELLNEFYDTLIMGAGNDVARRILVSLRARVTYLRTVTATRTTKTRTRETVQLLKAIATAASQRDGDLVARRCRAFVERSAAFAFKVLADLEAEQREDA
jgi:DNA-binding GntR family transcriptional regulator